MYIPRGITQGKVEEDIQHDPHLTVQSNMPSGRDGV